MVEAIFTLGSAAFIILLGLLVMYGAVKDKLRQTFFGFCLSMAFWQISLYLSEQNISQELLLNKLTFIGPVLAALFFFEFIRQLISSDREQNHLALRSSTWLDRVVIPVAIITSLVALTPYVVADTQQRISPNGTFEGYNIDHGPLYGVYLAALVFLLLAAFYELVVLGKSANPQSKRQSSSIKKGLIFAVIVGLTANVLVPSILNSSEYSYLGSLAVLLLVFVLAFAIARHKLIDVRSFVARSFGYLLTIATMLLLYTSAIVLLIRQLFGTAIDPLSEVILGILLVISALAFRPTKLYFDKLTNKLFYQDAYDPQQLYADLNKTLVSSLDTKYLMTQSISVIETALKPEFAALGFAGAKGKYRMFSSRKLNFSDDTVDYVRKTTPHIHHKVIVADYLERDGRNVELRKTMNDNNVAVLVRLTQDVRHTEEGLGYLMLGNKKSGNPYTTQDVQTLETVANELIIAVQNALHYEEIQQFNEQLQSRIDDATRKLRSTNEKLKALDETKDDFISMASHQLRTPLTSVKGYLSMVLEGDAGKLNATQEKMLGQAFVSSQRMVYLIADLLNVSRLRTGKFVIEPHPTDLSHMIEEELSQLVETAKAREITLTYKKPKDFPQLMLDETKTRQVVMNFVDNAIYYTQAGGTIEVKLEATGHAVELRVVDNGIGVPKHEQHHLFNKFYRAANARKARPDGTGLGLFMAKKVVVAEGGSIIFDSKEGRGSTFGFSFPLRKLAIKHEPVTEEPKTAPKKLTKKK